MTSFFFSWYVAHPDLHLLTHSFPTRRASDLLEHPQRPILDHHLERAAEQEVADEHRGAVAPDHVRGLAPAAQVRLIDHVVVEQSRGVDEFDGRRQFAMEIGRASCRERGCQYV